MRSSATTDVRHSRWAALGAAIATSLGAGGLMTASADVGSGERPAFVAIAPCRVADTRPAPDNVGARNGALGPGETYTLAIRGTNGNCTIPADAVGVGVNLAAVAPSADSYLTLFPSDAARPLAANLNVVGGQPPVSNAATVRLGADGSISVYNLAGTVHVTLDVTGYYVGHDHDDRYYSKAETDAKMAETDAKVAAVLGEGVITNAMLAANAVTGDKVADNSIGSADVAPLHGDLDIIDNSITTFDLADNSVDADEVLDFGLTNQDIGVLYAQVTAGGGVAGSSGAVTASKLGVGQYEVDFGRNISSCAFVASVGSAVTGTDEGMASTSDRSGNVEAVFVQTNSTVGANADLPFHLVVVC